MEIYYVKIDDALAKTLSKKDLKKLQSATGRKIVDFIAQNKYKIKDREIIIENDKPKFKHSEIQFSISHSNKIVAVGFADFPIGLDVEIMKERNFEQLGKHYNINTSDKIEFYKRWTKLEAEIKLQAEPKQLYTEIFEDEYTLTIVTTNDKFQKPEIQQLSVQQIS